MHKHAGYKKRDLFPENEASRRNDNQMISRAYRRCKKDRMIKPTNLEWLAKELDVAVVYLKGELDWPLESLNGEFKKAYEKYILDPARFPYRGWYQLQSQVNYEEYEKQLLEVHGINHSRLSSLNLCDQLDLLESIDKEICRRLNKYFPELIYIDYRDVREGYDIDDIKEILVEYIQLEENL
jgi:hypothetical protein